MITVVTPRSVPIPSRADALDADRHSVEVYGDFFVSGWASQAYADGAFNLIVHKYAYYIS